MAKSKKYLPYKVYLSLPGTGKKLVRVPVKAKRLDRHLVFARTMEHVRQGVQGECATCANAIAASAAGIGDLVQFTDSRVYIVDKFNKKGTPTECTVGVHDQGAFQREFDTHKQALLRSDRAAGLVSIRPLSTKKHGGPGTHPKRTSGTSGGRRAKRARGAAARALRAGIMAA